MGHLAAVMENCLLWGEPSHIYWPEVSEVKGSVRIAKETHRKEIQSKEELGFSPLKKES